MSLVELTPARWASYPHTLADVVPAIDAARSGHDETGLSLPDHKDVVLFLVDGLGATLLDEHAEHAPTLAALRTRPLRAGFPATTATSITSLTGGTSCGVHGIIGYSFRPDDDCRTRGPRRVLNALRWSLDGSDGPSALVTYPPDLVSNQRSALTALAASGVQISYVMPGEFRGTGMTQVAFRAPGRYLPAVTPAGIRDAVQSILARRTRVRRLVYAYFSELDTAGHIHGPGSPAWLAKLELVDRLVADLASDLPRDAMLLVTGDHGMVAVENPVDIDAAPQLTERVDAIAGEARVRHVYTPDGAADDVLATWTTTLGPDAHVVSREQAVDQGWFGHPVSDQTARRIGDVVAVARGTTALIRSRTEPFEARLTGQHGAWAEAEQLVPLLVATGT